jgi:hypothetical protein
MPKSTRKVAAFWPWGHVSKTHCVLGLSAGNIQMPKAANKTGYANDWRDMRAP